MNEEPSPAPGRDLPPSPWLSLEWEPEPAPPRASWWRGCYGLVSLLLVISLCVGLGGGLLGYDWLRAQLARREVSRVLDDFMVNLGQARVSNAYTLFSSRGKHHMPQAELDRLVQDAGHYFEGYHHLQLSRLEVRSVRQQNARLPQGTIAEVEATLFYSDGVQGRLSAVLEKEDDRWRIYSFYLSVPPNIGDYQQA